MCVVGGGGGGGGVEPPEPPEVTPLAHNNQNPIHGYHKDDTQTDKETNKQQILKQTKCSPFLHELYSLIVIFVYHDPMDHPPSQQVGVYIPSTPSPSASPGFTSMTASFLYKNKLNSFTFFLFTKKYINGSGKYK